MDWKNVPSLTGLRALEATARLGGFSAAARELNVTHAAIAQQVRALEEFFGQGLVFRDGRKMELTEAGARLAGALNDGFGAILNGVQALQDTAETRPLAVSVTPTFAENWLMPRLGAFWAKHPEIELSIQPSERLVDLRRDGIDLAIRYGRGNWTGCEVAWLAPANYVVVGTPALLAGRKMQSAADLTGLPWVLEGTRPEAQMWAKNHGIGFEGSRITQLNTNVLVLAAARNGLGLSIQGEIVVQRELKDGTLVAALRAPVDDLGYYLVTRSGVQTSAMRKFIGWIKGVA
jgi:LysR family glycine cleavage system transcriptional activator